MMTTLDRIDPAYTPWSPSAAGMATETDSYVGRHRRPGIRRLGLATLFYSAKHRTRTR